MLEQSNDGLWIEKYRPTQLAEYVGNSQIKNSANKWIEDGEIPHILLYSQSPGTGKTTLAKLLANSLDATVLYINCSDENGVDAVRNKIKDFASTMGFSRWKLVILDECDQLTPEGQAILRNMMETYSGTCRFILTCNFVNKLMDPVRSRCQQFEIIPPSKQEIAKRLLYILNNEGIVLKTSDTIRDVFGELENTFIPKYYPDMRTMINVLQQIYVSTGHIDVETIKNGIGLTSSQDEYLKSIVDMLDLSNGELPIVDRFNNIRQIINDNKITKFSHIYRYLFDNLDVYATGHIAAVIPMLSDFEYKESFVNNTDIMFCSCILNIFNLMYDNGK